MGLAREQVFKDFEKYVSFITHVNGEFKLRLGYILVENYDLAKSAVVWKTI